MRKRRKQVHPDTLRFQGAVVGTYIVVAASSELHALPKAVNRGLKGNANLVQLLWDDFEVRISFSNGAPHVDVGIIAGAQPELTLVAALEDAIDSVMSQLFSQINPAP